MAAKGLGQWERTPSAVPLVKHSLLPQRCRGHRIELVESEACGSTFALAKLAPGAQILRVGPVRWTLTDDPSLLALSVVSLASPAGRKVLSFPLPP